MPRLRFTRRWGFRISGFCVRGVHPDPPKREGIVEATSGPSAKRSHLFRETSHRFKPITFLWPKVRHERMANSTPLIAAGKNLVGLLNKKRPSNHTVSEKSTARRRILLVRWRNPLSPLLVSLHRRMIATVHGQQQSMPASNPMRGHRGEEDSLAQYENPQSVEEAEIHIQALRYSAFNTSTGSTRPARRAGGIVATAVAAARSPSASAYATGSNA